MPALLTRTSIDLKRDSAVSTILAAVAGSPMWPSTRATWLEAATSLDWVTFRELATTLKPRSTNPFTIPVFSGTLMVTYLENILLPSGSEIRVQHDAVTGLARFKPGEGLVDLAHREVFGLRQDIVARSKIEHSLNRHR